MPHANSRLSTAASLLATVLMATIAVLPAAAQYVVGYGGGYHASTPLEGAYRGLADAIRSTGAANLMTSQAAINYTQAYAQQLQIRGQLADAYLQRRQAARVAEQEKIAAARASEAMFRQGPAPLPRLTSVELDPVTGAIDWPDVLAGPDYAMSRQTLDELFRQRAEHGSSQTNYFVPVVEAVNAMRGVLISNRAAIPADQFEQASNFLRRLTKESRIPAA